MTKKKEDRPRERAASRTETPILPPLTSLAMQFQQAIKPAELQAFADSITVSVETLMRLSIGRDGDAWTFPERDDQGEIIGIARRSDFGEKHMVKGSRRGLTMPWPLDPYDGTSSNAPVLVVEGQTDTAAGIDMGFVTSGRPSASGGLKYLKLLLFDRHIVIVGENDEAGRLGAKKIAEGLVGATSSVKIIYPPDGMKDLRAWKQAGCDRATLEAAIRKAAEFQPPVRTLLSHRSLMSPLVTWPEPMGDEVYHGLMGEIVRLIEPHTEADRHALLVQMLVAFGNAAGRSAHYLVEADKHHLNLFCTLVGETSKARKGMSWGHVRRLFGLADEGWAKNSILNGLSSGEGLIWAVRDPIMKREPLKKQGRVTGEYNEYEADSGVVDKRLLVQESEFSSTLRVMRRDGNILSAIIRAGWDTGDLRTMTKNSPAVATDAHISIVGHITREELLRDFYNTDAANGFGNRFLFVCVRRSKCLPEGGQSHKVNFTDAVRRLRDALSFAKTAGRVSFDDDARNVWYEVYRDLSEGQSGLVGAVISRAEAQVVRLAAICALLDQSVQIRVEHLMAALAVWEYCQASARYIFGDAIGDPVADELLRLLRSRRTEGVTRTQMRDHFGRHTKSDRIGAALVKLENLKVARMANQETGGRPVEVWFVTDLGCDKSDISDQSLP